MRTLRDLTVGLMSMAFLSVCLITIPAQAAMVPTHKASQNTILEIEKNKVMNFVAREDVQKNIIAQGINPNELGQKIDQMTAAEISLINQNIDQVPAGGDALTVLLVVFVVLLITDIAGFTDIFPFVVKRR